MAQSFTAINALPTTQIGGSNVSAFGDLIVANHTPVVQLDFVYGINTQTGTSAVLNSAIVDTSVSRLRLQSGTNAAGSAIFQSVRIARYRQGQGMMARFTGVWLANAASSTQVIGVGNATVGYFFGYNGTAFGLSIRNGGSDSWTAQTAWNGDRCDGTGASGFNWNPTLGNVMMIRYPYLGYGAITFWVQNPITDQWILCHTIQYPNSSASVQLTNPSFPFYAAAINAGSTTNLTMYVGSVGIFISGPREYLGAQWAFDNNKATITTETCLLNLRNCVTYNGSTNLGVIRLRSLSCSSNGGGTPISVIRFKKGVTIGGSPSYTTINGTTADNGVTITAGNSIASVDTAGTTVTNGTYIYNISLATSSATIDLTPFLIYVNPGEILTVSGFATGSSTISASINWNEDV